MLKINKQSQWLEHKRYKRDFLMRKYLKTRKDIFYDFCSWLLTDDGKYWFTKTPSAVERFGEAAVAAEETAKALATEEKTTTSGSANCCNDMPDYTEDKYNELMKTFEAEDEDIYITQNKQ